MTVRATPDPERPFRHVSPIPPLPPVGPAAVTPYRRSQSGLSLMLSGFAEYGRALIGVLRGRYPY